MIVRDITLALKKAAKQFSAIAVVGPRQSGKTTLVQSVFEGHAYVSLEDLDLRAYAQSDPRDFLETRVSSQGIILDEIQHVPELLSYIQTIIDREKKKGYFIITGSQNILLNQAITQTLAGRIAILTLLPLSINELSLHNALPNSIEEFVFKGALPRIYDENIDHEAVYKNYIRSYIERDVRDIKKIFDLSLFQKFVQLCAGRIGQLLNVSSLANDCGIDSKTAQSWLSVLEATYVIFLLHPYYKNFGKRLIKAPKLYFVDAGIACSLLRIRKIDELKEHYLRGSLVESLIISDLYKQFYNLDQTPSLYFWRDHLGNEVDCIIEKALELVPIEIKAGKTISSDYFKQFEYLTNIKDFPAENNTLIYAGSENQKRKDATVLAWKNSGTLVRDLIV